ncbi:glycoside hydrolase family 172 protein [Pedobacter sp. ASV12]|uniref:glycoside hydrolase family 172 protein n=1 Tax=Pedobacter sp. ASV12 TaxID=2795120 RepID=UPI0018EB8FFF|nr:glycoside hydrolase family 172 protein [Pedobacter sp. ASV12]
MVRFMLLLCLACCANSLQGQELFRMKSGVNSRLISFENMSGAKGSGGKENNGAKGHATETIFPGKSRTIVDYLGTGIVQRIWCTISERSPEVLRSIRIQMYWDGDAKPAVDVPIGDFFGLGLGQKRPFESVFFSDAEGKSFNCFIPMPFRKQAKIIFVNESRLQVNLFYDVAILETAPHQDDVLYFHAYWSRKIKADLGEDFEILPKITGKGRFLGTNIGVIADSLYQGTWWGEGEVKMYIDEDGPYPTINGTGTEDYVGAAWGLGTFNHQYQGCLIADNKMGYFAFYRYHVPDEIYFTQSMRVTIQELGGSSLETARALLSKGVKMKPVIANSKIGYLKLNAMNPAPHLSDEQFRPGGVLFYRIDDYSATSYFYLNQTSNNLPALQPLAIRTQQLKTIK